MDRQRSFSFKPTRLYVFSVTISSLILCFFFSFLVFKGSSSNFQITLLHFSGTSLSFDLKTKKSLFFTTFSGNSTDVEDKNPIFTHTHLRIPANSSNGSVETINSPISSTFGRNFTSLQVKNPILNHTHVRKRANSSNETVVSVDENFVSKRNQSDGFNVRKKRSGCDVSNGMWVFDERYPLYDRSSCQFIDEGFSCEANGRLDRDYMKWRWQPHQCSIPRFDAAKMLELIRGKRLVFVGDSINRNQWESMLCLLIGAVANPKRVYEARGRRITKEKGNYNFKFVDYRCSVEYYVTHFLVHESKARIGRKRKQTLRIDTIDKSSSRWKGADILVFNTAHWWSHYKTKAGVNYYQEGDQVHHQLDVSTAFRKALMTWASWVDQHVVPGKTQIFFRSSAPSHFRGGQWNAGGHCEGETSPLNDTSRIDNPEKNMIVEQVIQQMKTPVTLLNVTRLSELRIDGHPSIYGRKPGKDPPSRSGQDCSHWCLPGVPDAWNELLYFYLLSKQKTVRIQ